MNKLQTNILLIDIAYSEEIYIKLAKELKLTHGISTTIVSFIKKRSEFFETQGVRSVYIDTLSVTNKDYEGGKRLINELESTYPDFRYDLTKKRDRFLRYRNKRVTERRLFKAAKEFQRVLEEEKPVLVLGEISTAIEFVYYFVCANQNIPYRHLLNLPSQKPLITLFDYSHSAQSTQKTGVLKSHSDDELVDYKLMCSRVKKRDSGVKYFFKTFGLRYSKNDYRASLRYKLRYALKPFYKLFYRTLEAVFFRDFDPNKKGLFVALHVQPESTPDFVSSFYADQLDLIERLSEAVPKNMEVFVKEHPNVLSMRAPFRLLRLLLKGNITFVKRHVDSCFVIQNVECIATIAGTIAVEAAEYGTPVLVFSDIFYKSLPNVIDAREFVSLSEAIQNAVGLKIEGLDQKALDQWFSTHGAPGIIHDPRIVPEVVEASNIKKIATLVANYIQ